MGNTPGMIGRRPARSGGRRLLLAPVAALVLVLALAAGGARTATATVVHADRSAHVLLRSHATLSAARLAQSAISWTGGPTVAATGETVSVYVSASLPPELGTPQSWADFIAGLLHGPELSSLTAYVARFAETQAICGEHALGCYSANRMVSMGETAFGVTAAEVVRHEYGHHIAFHRLNPPWRAVEWGPKNWASARNVCRRAEEGSAYPGDQDEHYFLNPGEAWAETYRLLDERRAGVTGSGWQIIDPSFYPDEPALQAAERDVVQPWTAQRTLVHGYRFTPKSKRMWTVTLQTPLDGSVNVTVSLPKGGLHEIALVDPTRNRVLSTALWAGQTSKTIASNVCGERALRLQVRQRGAFGPVKLVAQLP